ncbi:MAG: aminoacyl-tRNA hydrolase [Actinomycetota bacterium]
MSLFRRRSGDASAGDRWIVFCLGNPGEDYARTRHNAGVMVLAELLQRTGMKLKSHKSGCLIAETDLDGHKVVLARSTTFMNESGRPLGQLLRWYKAGTNMLIIVHDEIDIPFGEVRIKTEGGTAGHNGLKSIAMHLGTKDFTRVRVGASRPRGQKQAADHVLSEFSAAERKELPEVIGRAADAVETIVSKGTERAMNTYNTRA